MGRLVWCLLLFAAAMLPGYAYAQDQERLDDLFPQIALTDTELAQQRGGFTLPGGVQVALAAAITTDVNGARLLQTTLQLGAAGSSAAAQAAGAGVTRLDPRGAIAAAALPGLSVEHFVGQRLGSVIANSADGRVIDHQLSIDLSLSNVQPLALGSAMFRVQALGLDAGILRATGG